MLFFPNAKINLGLNVVSRRPDGFHNIQTVFYPVPWRDALEVIETSDLKAPFQLHLSGLGIAGNPASNLLHKAWLLVKDLKKLPPIKVHLHKHIPMGAGLGGGSSDAAFFIKLLDKKFSLGFSESEKLAMASELGSDCAFFIHNTPLLASGKGNEFSEIRVDLSSYYILVVYPHVHSNTKEAYEGIVPKNPAFDLKNTVEQLPVAQWKNTLVNDFEQTIFKKYPRVAALKEHLYERGALYAAMSGSGSAVFGIFEKEPFCDLDSTYSHCLQIPTSEIL